MPNNTDVIRSVRLTLDAARTAKKFSYPGRYIKVRRASSAAATITLHFDEASNAGIALVRDDEIRFKAVAFSQLFITHDAQAGEWVELVISADPDVVVGTRASLDDVNIAGQDADVDVNIAAQDADVDVNIAAQDADVDVNLNAQADNLAVGVGAYDPASKGTPVEASHNQTTTAATTVYTVSAGKTLTLDYVHIQVGSGTEGRAIIKNQGGTVLAYLKLESHLDSLAGLHGCQVPAQGTIEVERVAGSNDVNVSIAGYEN